MDIVSLARVDALLMAILFGASAAAHLYGPEALKRAYTRWGFPGRFYRVSGTIQLLAALFLTNGITRVWGVALAAFVTFAAVVLLLSQGRYRISVPGMLILAALVPAILAGPIQAG